MRLFFMGAALCALITVACDPKIPEGIFACRMDDECPSGRFCHADGFCYQHPDQTSTAVADMDAGSRQDDAETSVQEHTETSVENRIEASIERSVEAGVQEHVEAGVQEHAEASMSGMETSTSPNPDSDASSLPGTDAGDAASVQPASDCDTSPDESVGIFVSPAGSSAADCGSSNHACSSLSQGIARAKSTGMAWVYIDTGTYAEAVVLPPGLTLLGGFNNVGGHWKRQCKSDRAASAVIASPTNVGVRAEYDGAATLDTLTVSTKPVASAGESIYGVFARGTSTELTLKDVIVTASAAGDGFPGMGSTTPAAASGTCPAADGANGGDGTPGTGALAGSFSVDGYAPADGHDGSPGAAGHHGTPAGAGTCVVCTDGTSCTRVGTLGLICGNGTNVTGNSCGSAGSSGCGGASALGAKGGHGGGSSVAIFAWDAKVSVSRGALQAGKGGQGGLGGDSAAGGPGSGGTTGANGPTCTGCFRVSSCFPDAPCSIGCGSTSGAGSGTTAGNGGTGGKGGSGGGGSGGFSFAVYKGGSANVNLDDATARMHGTAGTSLGNGAVGMAADIAP